MYLTVRNTYLDYSIFLVKYIKKEISSPYKSNTINMGPPRKYLLHNAKIITYSGLQMAE